MLILWFQPYHDVLRLIHTQQQLGVTVYYHGREFLLSKIIYANKNYKKHHVRTAGYSRTNSY